MNKLRYVLVSVLVLISVSPCFADDREKLVGTWRVVSFETEYQGTGQREAVLGKNPTGYYIYTKEGHLITLITGEGRKAAATDQERAQLWRSMAAMAGTYRVEGDKLILKVEVSSMPTWVGTERITLFRIDGNRLQTMSAEWADAPLNPERGKMRTIVTLERVQ